MGNSSFKLDYLMESEAETQRLEGKFDEPSTIDQMKDAGILKAKSALDVGCGSGRGAAVMAQLIGPLGKVCGLDGSERRINFGKLHHETKNKNLSLVLGSASQMPFSSNTFDFTWSRFLFEYLSDPRSVLEEMIRVTANDGKIIVGDLDHNCQMFYPFPEHLEKKWNEVFEFAKKNHSFDKDVGRKLFKMFFDCGLKDIKVRFYTHHLIYGAMNETQLSNWSHKLETIKRIGLPIFSNEKELVEFCKEIYSLWSRPDFFVYSPLFIVEGRKG